MRLRTLIVLGVFAAQPARAALIELGFPSAKELWVESSYQREETKTAPPDTVPDSAMEVSIDAVFGRPNFHDGRRDVCTEGDGMFADAHPIRWIREPGAGDEPVKLRGYYLLFDSAQLLSADSPERLEIDVSAPPIPAPPSEVLAVIGGILLVLAAGGGPQPSSIRPAPPRRLPPPIICRRVFSAR